MSSAADPTAAFFANLRASGLLTEGQLKELWAWIGSARPEVKGVAAEIYRRGWLTRYQIKEIFHGRGRDLRLGPYLFLDLLGEGGMGRVFKAHHLRLEKDVAVKVIRKERLSHPAADARFLQEVAALAKMRHPNVVEVFNADQIGDIRYYEMEYIDGTDLTKMVRDRGPLAIPEACEYIRQAAHGLQHAFETGLVHRDIKPSNLIVARTGQVKLVDLGLARLMEPAGDETEARITHEGFVIGTPDFLAPEQARNPKIVDIRADIYALGGTLFYLLTGKVPYPGANATEKLMKHCTEPPPRLLAVRADGGEQLDSIIQWCMAKQPEGRPQTPLQVALALQPFCLVSPFAASTSGRHPMPAATLAANPSQASVSLQPLPPGGSYPHPPSAYTYSAAQQQPAGFPQLFNVPDGHDPSRSSQLFKLPPQTTTADPIRRRGEAGFPWSTVLLGFGAILVLGILGFGLYQALRPSDDGQLETFTNTQGMKMVLLPGGKFRMGSTDAEPGHKPEEAPQHEVSVKGPFFVAATEVSHSQFQKVMGTSPSKSAQKANRAQDRPVEYVTWDEANDFCIKLTHAERGQKWQRKGWVYRLPTEAEWEYACRAGTETPFAFGDHIEFEKQAVFLPVEDDPLHLGIGGQKKSDFPEEVGRTQPNAFGLHDMHGNVGEWCLDWYKSGYPAGGPRDNPIGPADGYLRVVRGGSYKEPAAAARSAARRGIRPQMRNEDVGFRIVYASEAK